MSESVAIIAALPREVKALVRGWEQTSPAKNVFVWTKDNAVVACAGMGPSRAILAVQAAMASGPITSLLSVGVAGACDPKLRVGDVVRAGLVIDARTGEKFGNAQFRQVLVTAAKIAGVKEKRRLFEAYNASAVDMEAATVARMAAARGLYFCAIKSVSDGADFEMEELGNFATADGQFREGAFAAYAALRPAMWGRLIGLGRNSTLAVDALTTELETELSWYRERGWRPSE
jgi:adenosylhomocysteine nucleosidase